MTSSPLLEIVVATPTTHAHLVDRAFQALEIGAIDLFEGGDLPAVVLDGPLESPRIAPDGGFGLGVGVLVAGGEEALVEAVEGQQGVDVGGHVALDGQPTLGVVFEGLEVAGGGLHYLGAVEVDRFLVAVGDGGGGQEQGEDQSEGSETFH